MMFQLTGIMGRHLPRTGVHHYAIRAFILCKLSPEPRSNFIVTLFSQLAGFAVHFTSWPDCKLKPNGII